jgi:hypothetical protein
MEQHRGILTLVYTFFLGLLLAIFVGVGISAFYTAPKEPVYPTELNTYGKELTAEQAEKQRRYDEQVQGYNEAMKPYNRNVSIITLVLAVFFLTASILFAGKLKILADGVMLGGLFTLVYSIGRGFASENNKYVFLIVTIGLAIVLYLGYVRFVRQKPLISQTEKRQS